MLTAVALIPSAPVLVPELAGTAAAELADLTAAVRRCAAELPDRWVVVGVDGVDRVIGAPAMGTFAGYGADIRVALSPTGGELQELPLCGLLAAWLRTTAAPGATVEVRCYADDQTAAAAVEQGRRLRAELDTNPEPTGVLVVADGAHTLTPAAPGGYHPDSVAVQAALDDALAHGDTATLRALPDGVVGRVAYQVLAGLAGAGPRTAAQYYRGAPYGVGYFAGVWQL